MQKALMRGLRDFATVEDMDSTGYLGHADAAAAQKARIDFAALSEGLAAEYLHANQSTALAKQALRGDIRDVEGGTDTGKFTDDEAALLDRFERHVSESIERLAAKGGWQRGLVRWIFRTPTFVKLIIFVAIFTAVAVVVGRAFGK